jgi:hypothetical protein
VVTVDGGLNWVAMNATDLARNSAGEDLVRRLELAYLAFFPRSMAASRTTVRRHPSLELLRVKNGHAIIADRKSHIRLFSEPGLPPHGTSCPLEEVKACRTSKAESVAIELCFLPGPATTQFLADRGYELSTTTDVMVRRLGGLQHRDLCRCHRFSAGISVRRAGAGEFADWSRLVAHAFDEPDSPSWPPWLHRMASLPSVSPYVAECQSLMVGGGLVIREDSVAWFVAFSTIPAMRRRGVQQALLQYSLGFLAYRNCDIAAAEVAPKTSSARNFARAGFELLYTRRELTRRYHR